MKIAGVIELRVMDEDRRCHRDPAMHRVAYEDDRASASIDLAHDAADAHARITVPLLSLWGARATVGRPYDVAAISREKATEMRGCALDRGHLIQEEAPTAPLAETERFH